MIRSVVYSESWLSWSVDLKKWPVRKFMEPLKFITQLFINNNYYQSRKALTLLPAPPFLCADYITFEVGQWTQFLHWSFFILTPSKSERLEDTHLKVSYPHSPVKAQPARSCKADFPPLGSRGIYQSISQFHGSRQVWATGSFALKRNK